MSRNEDDSGRGASVDSGGDTSIGGDVVGRDKNTNIQYNYHIYASDGSSPRRILSRSPLDTSTDLYIIDAAAIIDYPIREIERYIGRPSSEIARGIGQAEDLPLGGVTSTYRVRDFEININSDNSGIACGLQVVSDLSTAGYILEKWPLILGRLKMTVTKEPDIVAPAAIHWKDYLGLAISVVAERPRGHVWSVRVYKRPN